MVWDEAGVGAESFPALWIRGAQAPLHALGVPLLVPLPLAAVLSPQGQGVTSCSLLPG